MHACIYECMFICMYACICHIHIIYLYTYYMHTNVTQLLVEISRL